MRLIEIVNVRRLAAVAALGAAVWCGQVHAQVLDQVPSDALAVLKVKSLDKTNAKVAKLFKTFGLDEMDADLKDPLGSMLEKAKLTKGIDKSGDGALALFPPQKHEKKAEKADGDEMGEPEPVALIPVSNYDAFVGNFKKDEKAEADGGITTVKAPDNDNKTLYIAHRGNYAIVSDKKDHLKSKAGIKLSPQAEKESDSKDAVFFFNPPVLRDHAIPQIKEHRKEWIDEMDKALNGEEQFKPYAPVLILVVNHVLDTAEDCLNDADGIVFSANITDTAINYGAMVEFKEGSKSAATVAKLKAGETPRLAGLPEGKYFLVGGASVDPKGMGEIADEWIDPVVKGLNDSNTDMGKKIAKMLETMKGVSSTIKHSAAGMLVPTKPMGQESLIQEVAVSYGDAKALASAEKTALTEMSDLMGMAPQQKGLKTSIVVGETKNVDGADLTTYTTKLDFDKNDPQGMQAEQIMGLIYGPNGMSGSFGAVDDKTFIVAQGVGDEVLKEVIASAKAGKDVLSDTAGIKSVSGQFPANRTAVYYIALDKILTSAVRYAQGFGLQVKLKLPQELPPIGVAVGVDGNAMRVDGVVPIDTVQAIIAAGLQAYTDMQGGGKGGGL